MDSSTSTRTVTPYLFYSDVDAAIEWLACAFGFRQLLRYEGGHGEAVYAELSFGVDRVMLAQAPSSSESRWRTGSVYVTVEDLERHFLRAKEAMPHVLWGPRDAPFGVREYCVEDPQGQQWVFAQQVRDVEPAECHAPRTSPVRAMLAEPVGKTR